MARLFCWLALLSVWLALPVLAAPVMVSGPLFMADGVTLANGTVTISWNNFKAGDGQYVPAGSKIVTVKNGAFSQLLEPGTNAAPNFSYRITYKFGSQTPAQCTWVVPTANSFIPDIEVCPAAATSVPAVNIALSQISAGGGGDGLCVTTLGGVLSTAACTNFWTKNVNDIFNSNSGNIGIGATPGNFKVDISKSGSAGTLRLFDQTPSTGATQVVVTAGAGQGTFPLVLFQDNTGTFQSGVGAESGPFSGTVAQRKLAMLTNLLMSSDACLLWHSLNSIDTGVIDSGICRNASGVTEVNNGTPGVFRDMKFRNLTLTGLAGVSVQCVHVDSNGLLSGTGSDCGNGGGGGGNAWTVSGNDIFNSNSGNVGVGSTPGPYKLDISRSGASGTARFFDQTATTGNTFVNFVNGAGQNTNVVQFTTNAGLVQAGVDRLGAFFGIETATGHKQFGLAARNGFYNAALSLSSDYVVGWYNNLDVNAGTPDTGLGRNTSGILEVDNGTLGTFRDLALRNLISSNLAGSGARCVHVDNTGTLSVAAIDCVTSVGIPGSASISFGTIQDGTCSTQNLTVTGALTGGKVAAGWPSTLEANLDGLMRVVSTNTVEIRLCNLSGAPITPATQTFAATVF